MKKKRIEKLKNLAFNLLDMEIPVYAANACYFLAISIFPALLLVLASLRYTALSATDLIWLLEGILPGALMGAAESLIVSTYYNSSAGLLGISALAMLWSSSRGVHGLLTGLNRIYGVHEDRGWIYTRLISVGYTFVFLLLLIVTLVFQVFGESLADRLWLGRFLSGLIDLHSVWLVLVQILVFVLIYMVLPNRRNRFLWSLPGAMLAALGLAWLLPGLLAVCGADAGALHQHLRLRLHRGHRIAVALLLHVHPPVRRTHQPAAAARQPAVGTV